MKKYFSYQIFQSAIRQNQKLVENAILVSAEKVMAPLPLPKFNPGFGSRYQISVAHYVRNQRNLLGGILVVRLSMSMIKI